MLAYLSMSAGRKGVRILKRALHPARSNEIPELHPLSFVSSSVLVRYEDTGGIRSFDTGFSQNHSLGVFAEQSEYSRRKNIGRYSLQMCNITRDILSRNGSEARGALQTASAQNMEDGATTACVVGLKGSQLNGINVGDCAFALIRNGKLFYRTVDGNFTITRPHCIGRRQNGSEINDLSLGTDIDFTVYSDDVIIMGSDGLWDNIYTEQVVEIVNETIGQREIADKSTQLDETLAKRIAEAVAGKAIMKARDPAWPSPFQSKCPKHYHHNGGKSDDVLVICAFVIDSLSTGTENIKGARLSG